MRAEFSLDYDVVTVEQPQKLYLMAQFTAGTAVGDQPRRPLNLSLVIDRSGSMAGDKISYTRHAAQFLVQHLGSRDTLSIILYNDRVETLLPPEPVQRKDAINEQIEGIRVFGTTNLSGGWLEGCTQVATNQNPDVLNRVILMSDGLANRGVTDTPTLVSMAAQKQDEGISTTTMGLGSDFNEDLMMEMAHAGGGAFYFIESPEVAPVIFKEELSGLLNVVGQNLTISIITTDQVSLVTQLNAYPMSSDGTMLSYRLGDIFGDEVKTLVLELAIPAMTSIGEAQIATLRFEYDEITGGKTEHQMKELPVMVNVQPPGEAPQLADPDVAASVMLLKAAQARRQAVKNADAGKYKEAAEGLRSAAQEMEAFGLDNDTLKEEHDSLLKQAKRMDRGSENYDAYSRKTMVTQSLYTMTNRHDDTQMLRLRELSRQTELHPQPPTPSTEDALHIPRQQGVTPTQFTWNQNTYDITADLIRIGRSSHNEIVIKEKGVSRFHAQLRREGDTLIIEDLGSTNGTLIDGERLKGPHVLSVGDEVYICDEKLIFHSGELR